MPIQDEIGKHGRFFLDGSQIYFTNISPDISHETVSLESNNSYYPSKAYTGGDITFDAEYDGAQPELPTSLMDNNLVPVPKTELTAEIQGIYQSLGFVNILLESWTVEFDATNGGMANRQFSFTVDAGSQQESGHGEEQLARSAGFERSLGGQ